MTYYIIRRGTHENHGNNISWLEWESREKEEVIKAYFNELETYPHQSIAEKRLLELLRTDEASVGWYNIRRIQMDDSIVAQYKKGE